MPQRQLKSWKEIAAHLGVSVRTAQRWEATEKLPVRRHRHAKLSSVYADPEELARWWEGRPARGPAPSIAVLPFVNLDRHEDTEILGDGLTEDLITALSQVPRLRVVARSSAFWFKGRTLDLREIGSRLGVGHVLQGSLRRSGNRLRVTAQLVRAEDGCHLWAERFDRELDDPFDLQEQLAQAIAGTLRVRLLEDRPGVHRTHDMETYNAFLRGRFFWNKRTPQALKRALGCFGEAIARDPQFALGHAGRADCYCFLIVFGDRPSENLLAKAEAAVAQALTLDPLLGDAHTSLGLSRILRLDFPGAEAAFRRALELSPGDHRARHWRAMTLVSLGRHDEALAEIERALDLDPFGVTVNQDAGRILYAVGRYDEAILRLRHTREIAPHARWAPCYLALAAILVGDYEGALDAVPEDRVFHAFVRARMGAGDDARELLRQTAGGDPLSLARQAVLHLGLGEEGRAVELFRRGLEHRQVDAFEVHRGMLPFVEDAGLRAELDSLLAAPW